MTIFEDIARKSLLTELNHNRDKDIINAINNALRVRMSYNDRDKNAVWNYDKTKMVGPDKGKNERYILPVAYGLTKSNEYAIRAYQTAGSSRRGEPHWKLFLLDNIFSWSNGSKSFKDYRNALINNGFNVEGDKDMTTLFAFSPLGNADVQVTPISTTQIDSNPVSKAKANPTTALQNPQTTDKSNYIDAQAQRNTTTNIDNIPQPSYTNNAVNMKIDAPDTKPVTKQGNNVSQQTYTDNSFTTQDNPEQGTDTDTNEPQITSGPVSKDQLGGENELTAKFKDLTDRMNNLYKDNDEDEEKI